MSRLNWQRAKPGKPREPTGNNPSFMAPLLKRKPAPKRQSKAELRAILEAALTRPGRRERTS